MIGVPDTGRSTDLWRFDTSTRRWQRVDNNTSTNGTGPSARYGHVMTSVGVDLWLHGGFPGYLDLGENDGCSSPVTLLMLLCVSVDLQ